jgi:hypothetical protein
MVEHRECCQEAIAKIKRAPSHPDLRRGSRHPQPAPLAQWGQCETQLQSTDILRRAVPLRQAPSVQSLTILTTTPNRLLTKNLETGESYAKSSRLVAAETCDFATLKQLKRILGELADKRNSCVIRGVLGADAPEPLRRRLTHFRDEPAAWVMLDIDSVTLPKRLWTYPYTDAHALFASRRMPAAFHGCGFVWQASASAGTDLRTLKVHLWFLLDAPLTAAQLRRWLKGAPNVDPSTLRAVQPHYTADPIGGPAGTRLGIIKGPRATTPDDITSAEPEPASACVLAPRPKGCADVSDRLIETATKQAVARARELLNACQVAYQDSYTVGTLLGPAVALSTWNDKAHGHETWRANAERLAAKWGRRFAHIDTASHGVELYSGRVLEGLEWAVRQERERLAGRSAKAAAEAVERTKVLREQLLAKMLRNAGSERVLKEVGAAMGRYSEVLGRDTVVAQLVKTSGLSQAQVERAVDAAEPVALDSWREGLLHVKDEIVATDENILAIYNKYPGFRDSFRYNVRSSVLEVTEANVFGLAAAPVSVDAMPGMLATWLGSLGMRKVAAHRAYALFASMTATFLHYDPFLVAFPEAAYTKEQARAALAALPKRQLDRWLTRYLGVTGDKAYVRAVAAKTLIAAVARAVRPGAQVDTMLVLIGEQGIGKTSAIRTLASVIDNGYSELLSMTDKDSLLAMQNSLLVEVSELRALRYGQEEYAKAFLTRTFDRLRAPYARTADDHQRRMVFIGTTNDDDFLSDRANRRYWPVLCGQQSTLTKAQAVELWREAALRFASGDQWWLSDEESVLQRDAAAAARAEDAVETVLRKQLRGQDQVTLVDAIRVCFPDSSDPFKHQRQVTAALKALGWMRKHTRKGKVWVKR